MKEFFAAFPTVKVVSPWNEANHFTQPTSRSPASAAKFTNTVAKLCKRCKIVVADILDQADDPAAKSPKFTQTAKYIATFRRSLKVKRGICGIHNYSDVNRFRSTGTSALMKSLGCKEYWLTETGGLYDFGSFWSKKTYKGCSKASSCQLKATKYMFTQAKKNKKIKRLYVYTWFGDVTPRFDAGLVADGKARPALAEIRKYTTKSLSGLPRLVVRGRRPGAPSRARCRLRTILRISGRNGFSIAGSFCSANSNSTCVPPSGRSLSV